MDSSQRSEKGKGHGRKLTLMSIYQRSTYVALKADVEEFLLEFEKEKTLNYADWARVWQKMKFTFVYGDLDSLSLIKSFCEIAVTLAKKYIMFQSNLYIKIGAFYLLYGLYYKQPIEGFIKIRLVLREFRAIKNLITEVMNKGQYDSVYIYAKMKADNAFLFVAQPKPLSLETKLSSSYIQLDGDDIFKSRGSDSSIRKLKDILKDNSVQALNKTCQEYEAKLRKFSKKYPTLDPIGSTVIKDLEEVHQQIFLGNSTVPDSEQPQKPSNLHSMRHNIKQKALTNKNAQYRGSKKCITGIDLKHDEF